MNEASLGVHAWAATYIYLVKRFTRNDGGDKQGDDCECQRGGVKRPLMVLRRGLVTQRAAFDTPQSPENSSISFCKATQPICYSPDFWIAHYRIDLSKQLSKVTE